VNQTVLVGGKGGGVVGVGWCRSRPLISLASNLSGEPQRRFKISEKEKKRTSKPGSRGELVKKFREERKNNSE